jgi:hypothetical protein
MAAPRKAPAKDPEVAEALKKRGRVRTQEEKEAKAWAGNEHYGLKNGAVQAKLKKTALLKSLIEPRTPELIEVMFDIAKDQKIHASVRLEAASRLLDRAYGKPKEHLVIDEPDPTADTDEVTKLLNNILEKVGAPLLEAPEGTRDDSRD